jgi:hypothetical protein
LVASNVSASAESPASEALGDIAVTRLCVVGASRAGKTTIAQRLAQHYDFDRCDLDGLLKQRDARRELIEVAQDWAIVAPLLEDVALPSDSSRGSAVGLAGQDLRP